VKKVQIALSDSKAAKNVMFYSSSYEKIAIFKTLG